MKWRSYSELPEVGQIEDINNLNEAIKSSSGDFRLALREIAYRKGGVAELAKKSGMKRESLYKILSDKGGTTTGSIFKIMSTLGYRFKMVKK